MKLDFSQLLTQCHNANNVRSLLSILISTGRIRRRHFVQQFLETCFRSNDPDLALTTFTAFNKEGTVSLQNLMLRGLGCNFLYEDVLSVYRNSRASGCHSDDFTFPVVIKACSVLYAFRSGEQLHGLVLKSGYGKNVVVKTALTDFYSKVGVLDSARQLFDEIPQPDLVSLNALLAGYSLHQLDEQALQIFKRVFLLGLKPNSSTLAAVIPACSFDFGRSVHGYALKSGFDVDALAPAFISMYAGDNSLHLSASRAVFDDCLLEKKTISVWNAMISAYSVNQMPEQAIELFQEMLRLGIQPDLITFVSIVPSCNILESFSYGELLHGFIIKHGSESKVPVTTALMSMYSKLGDIGKAEILFVSIPYNKKNLLLWNVIVSSYVRNELWYESIAAFREMQRSISPDAASIVGILTSCSKIEALLLGKSAHGYAIRKGIGSNVSNALLAFYSECNQLAWTGRLFRQMQNESIGFRPDSVTLITILPLCYDVESLSDGMALHCYAIKPGFDSDISLVNALISMYCRCEEEDHNIQMGRMLFETMAKRSVVSWNALITGYSHRNRADEVSILVRQMLEEDDHRPNSVTLLSLLPVCSSFLQVKEVHGYGVRRGKGSATSLLISCLISAYARFDRIETCLSLFETRKYNNLSIWNSIISAHVETRNAEKAVEFFHWLVESGLQPDRVTVLSLISASSRLNSSNLVDSLLAYTVRKGFGRDTAINNALIDSYSRTGTNISKARMVFDQLEENANVAPWNTMINGYGLHGDGESALELFSRVTRPDHATFSAVLSACSHSGLVQQGWAVFESMSRFGVHPRIEQYGCLVDMLGRSGYLVEAYEVVKKLLIRSCQDSSRIELILESLLGACRVYGNVEVAEEVRRSLVCRNSGSYVMLSNVYADAGRWGDADGVRLSVDRRKLWKAPGCSLLVGQEQQKYRREGNELVE